MMLAQTSLGLIPAWQFSMDPAVNTKINPNVVMPPGMTQMTVQPLPTSPGAKLAGLAMALSDVPTWLWVVLGGGALYLGYRHFGPRAHHGLRGHHRLGRSRSRSRRHRRVRRGGLSFDDGLGASDERTGSKYTVKQRAGQAEIKLDAIPSGQWSRARVTEVLRDLDTPTLREIERRHAVGSGIFTAGRQVAQWSREILNERER